MSAELIDLEFGSPVRLTRAKLIGFHNRIVRVQGFVAKVFKRATVEFIRS